MSIGRPREPHRRVGCVVWLTGLPAAGKTTLAQQLALRLPDTRVFDGDQLRAGISAGLGFGRDDRAQQARRATTLAVDHARPGALAIVALVSPFRADRDQARRHVQTAGLHFVEVFVDTPLEECRRRDPKGLYAAASAGRLRGLTGHDAPYEPPLHPEVSVGPGADGCALVLASLGEGGHPIV